MGVVKRIRPFKLLSVPSIVTASTLMAGVGVIAIMFVVIVDVIGRFAFTQPLPGGVEVAITIMAWVVFLSLAYPALKGTHIRMTLILNRLPKRYCVGAEALSSACALFLLGLACWGGWLQFWRSYEINQMLPAVIQIPYWISKLAFPVGVFMAAIVFGIQLVSNITRLARGK